MPSIGNPKYTVLIKDDKTTYDITPVMVSLDLSEQEDQMAQKAVITIMNTLIGKTWSTSVLQAGQRVYIYADDGENRDEVFNGVLWKKNYASSNSTREFKLTCYDFLIYFQESEVYYYYPAGKKTEDVLKHITEAWGVKFKYDYESIEHEKLLLKGTLSNIFMADMLDKVRNKTGKKYVIRMEKDTLHVVEVGINKKVYQILSGKNAVETKMQQSMEGMATRIVIFGKQGEGARAPVEATVEGNIKRYGTIQKVYGRNESASLEDAKKEAETLVNMGKWPFMDYEVTNCPDIPWLRKGDVVYINAGGIYQSHLMIKSISRSISNKGATMHLTLDNGVPREYQTSALTGSIASESKGNTSGGAGESNTGTVNDGSMSDRQAAVVNTAWSRGSAGYNLCATWVNYVFQQALGFGVYNNANDMVSAWCHYTDYSQLKPGMIIGCMRSPFGWAGATYGHIAIYVGNGQIRSDECGAIATYTIDGFNRTYGPPGGGSVIRFGWANGVPLA